MIRQLIHHFLNHLPIKTVNIFVPRFDYELRLPFEESHIAWKEMLYDSTLCARDCKKDFINIKATDGKFYNCYGCFPVDVDKNIGITMFSCDKIKEVKDI